MGGEIGTPIISSSLIKDTAITVAQEEMTRLKLGIIFNYHPSWMGGIVYITNIIETLNYLETDEKPELFVFYRTDLLAFVNELRYPYIKKIQWSLPEMYKGYIESWILRKNVFITGILENYELDGLFPVHDFPVKCRTNTKLVSWYADLQHKYYPDFFSRKKILERNFRIKNILKNSTDLVVSSQSVAADFRKFYRISEKCKIHIFHFVSVIGDFKSISFDEVRKKYNLPEKYYLISNQFHKHKNHRIILKSIILLREKGTRIHIVFTGKPPAASHSPYMKELYTLISNYNLQAQVSFVGVIPRNEQLLLMRHSKAVIQPSLFEGWSTVIEDAISLQVPVIASSLPVNIEQLGPDGNFFDPNDHDDLARILSEFPERNLDDLFYQDYNERVFSAAKAFLDIFR